MKPALLTFPHISSYPVLMLLGFFFGWLLARRRTSGYGIRPTHIDNLCLILPGAGLFGARLFARLFYAKLPLWEALKVWEGDGLVFYGGFLVSATAVIAYALLRRIPLPALLDCVAPSVALGLAFGRIGCFLGGCCWGDVCVNLSFPLSPEIARQVQTFPAISGPDWPLAVQFPARSDPFKQHVKLGLIENAATASLPVHPVQLYEAAAAFVLCFALHRRFRSGASAGRAALALLAGYAVIRFSTEYLRADNKPYWAGLTFSQVVSVWLLFISAAGALYKWKTAAPAASPESRQNQNVDVCTVGDINGL